MKLAEGWDEPSPRASHRSRSAERAARWPISSAVRRYGNVDVCFVSPERGSLTTGTAGECARLWMRIRWPPAWSQRGSRSPGWIRGGSAASCGRRARTCPGCASPGPTSCRIRGDRAALRQFADRARRGGPQLLVDRRARRAGAADVGHAGRALGAVPRGARRPAADGAGGPARGGARPVGAPGAPGRAGALPPGGHRDVHRGGRHRPAARATAARATASRVSELVSAGRAFARFEGDQVVFKAEIGALSQRVGQIQGVWVHPAYRGRGLGTGGHRRRRRAAQRDGTGVEPLRQRVQPPGRAAPTRRSASRQIASFATVLFWSGAAPAWACSSARPSSTPWRSSSPRPRTGRAAWRWCPARPGSARRSLVSTALAALPARARVLRGACDDLIAPRSFGPAAGRGAGHSGPLAAAVAAGADRDAVFEAAFAELSGRAGRRCWSSRTCTGPTTPRWTSLRLLGRRVADLPAVVVLTFRDDEVAGDHPLRRLLGALVGPHVRRLPLARLSAGAVRALADEVGLDGAAALAAHRGQPVLPRRGAGQPRRTVPPTVADAVLARVTQLDPATEVAGRAAGRGASPRPRVRWWRRYPAARRAWSPPSGSGSSSSRAATWCSGTTSPAGPSRRACPEQTDRDAPPGAGPAPGRARAGPAPGGAPRGGGGQRGGDPPVRAAGRAAGGAQRREPAGARRPRADAAPRRLLAPSELARLHIGHAWSLFNAGRYAEGLRSPSTG